MKEETVKSVGEFGCIDQICHDLIYRPELVKLGAGDDCAVYRALPGMDQLISTDTLVEGIHFTSATMGAADVGWKLCTANFSDIAAMGGEPVSFVISAALPDDLPLSWLTACYDGIRKMCQTHRVNLLGGDITGSRQGVVLTGTVVGMVPENTAVRRSGAVPGDHLAVTGTVGDSGAGLAAILEGKKNAYPRLCQKHQRPVPQIRAGSILRKAGVHALDDITDGLASESHEIAGASGVDLLIHGDAVPLSEDVIRLGQDLGKDPLSYALRGGEDYQLLVAGPGAVLEEAAREIPLTVIGEVREGRGVVYLERNGKEALLPRIGYDHFLNQ